MKRNEMLKAMLLCWEDHDGFAGCTAMFINERLLTVIEKSGMEPPLVEKEIKLDLNSPYDRRHKVTVNEWEGE